MANKTKARKRDWRVYLTRSLRKRAKAAATAADLTTGNWIEKAISRHLHDGVTSIAIEESRQGFWDSAGDLANAAPKESEELRDQVEQEWVDHVIHYLEEEYPGVDMEYSLTDETGYSSIEVEGCDSSTAQEHEDHIRGFFRELWSVFDCSHLFD